ncbi:MAG: hypothetical protein OXE59_01695 [Bacteroidetes bacterium]|nr:hypothetical protein [Bacteroidota bacterium]
MALLTQWTRTLYRHSPSKSSVQSICRKINEQTSKKYGTLDATEIIQRINWVLTGWSNYFKYGQVSPAYQTVDMHTIKRLRQ